MPESNITKRALAESMKQLMAKKPFSKISIAEICESCGMNRKSFYYHFKDKYDLVNWIFYTGFVSHVDMNAYDSGIDLMDDICRYFYEERKFYQEALRIEGQNSFREYFEETIRPVTWIFVKDIFDVDEKGDFEKFFLAFFCDAFLNAIVRWLTDDTMDADEFLKHTHRMILTLAKKIVIQAGNTET
ncbi:MAG TPA: dihydroxyacetone kinase transcriptional activator DhaS [Lachnospiraceae bacterium]|nr:dihydroxyacetone kinase transcriptional activator DhaS [Lachnospiraceae bacterium]